MISKGLDFPDVTLVGVIAADTSLNLPDFRSAERTFQMIAQVAGRSGRGNKKGLVIVQTYSPEHYSIEYARQHDYKGFYEKEIMLRKELCYPPFSHIANIIISGTKDDEVIKYANEISILLDEAIKQYVGVEKLGPAAAAISRIKNRFRWQILIKSSSEEILKEILRGVSRLTTPDTKINATRKYGANVKLVGQNFDEAYLAAREEQLVTGASFIHPFDDLAIIEGQATVAMEMLQQQPEIDTIVVPAGGGGLLAGTALAVKTIRPSVKVIGVQASNSPAIAQFFKGIRNPSLPFLPTIAEGICVREPGKLTMDIIRNYVDDVITVTEQEISSTILFMLEREKLLVEGAAAAAIAAVVNKRLPVSSKKTGVIVSGGNFDLSKLSECMGHRISMVQNF